MTHRATIDFMLYDWLHAEALCQRDRHAEHNRETFTAVIDLAEKVATEQFAPYNRLTDTQEPEFDGTTVHLPAQTPKAMKAFNDTGLLAASKDAELGGMQLPSLVEIAAMSFFYKSSVSLAAYPMLTRGNTNTILAHGTPKQIEVFAKGGQKFADNVVAFPTLEPEPVAKSTRTRTSREAKAADAGPSASAEIPTPAEAPDVEAQSSTAEIPIATQESAHPPLQELVTAAMEATPTAPRPAPELPEPVVPAVPQLPWTTGGVTYTSNQIRKVNIHTGVRSELRSRFTNDYVRNHITTSVDVRSLASVDRYVS